MMSLILSRALHSKSLLFKKCTVKLKEVLPAFVTTCCIGAWQGAEWRALALDGG